jgi:hypothetical protein
MARFGGTFESQTAVLAGVNSTVTANGYLGAIVAGASANFKVRRLQIGVRAGASVPTSQQMTLAVYRQTVRAVGTGLSNLALLALDPRSAASATSGLDITTGPTFGTNGPTLAANPIAKFSFNTQSMLDLPYELLEELICDQGTANGLGLVNIGNALPASHLFVVGVEIEE